MCYTLSKWNTCDNTYIIYEKSMRINTFYPMYYVYWKKNIYCYAYSNFILYIKFCSLTIYNVYNNIQNVIPSGSNGKIYSSIKVLYMFMNIM